MRRVPRHTRLTRPVLRSPRPALQRRSERYGFRSSGPCSCTFSGRGRSRGSCRFGRHHHRCAPRHRVAARAARRARNGCELCFGFENMAHQPPSGSRIFSITMLLSPKQNKKQVWLDYQRHFILQCFQTYGRKQLLTAPDFFAPLIICLFFLFLPSVFPPVDCARICTSCVGVALSRADVARRCESLDCPVLFARSKAGQHVQAAWQGNGW